MGSYFSQLWKGRVINEESEEISKYQFDFREMIQIKKKAIQEDYSLFEVRGKGATASVYRAVSRKGMLERAVKVIKRKEGEDKIAMSFVNEVFILKRLDHPNIIKVFDVYQQPRAFYLVSQLMTGGELFDRIIEKKSFTEADSCAYFYDILQIIRYLHSQKIMHRDIKPENLLFSDKGPNAYLKLIDFGTALEFENSYLQQRKRVGTSYYIAPEVIKRRYNQKCDIWSAGVILFIMLSGEPPFSGKEDKEILGKVQLGAYSFEKPRWKNVSATAKDLISRLLEMDTYKRISAAEAMTHPWFQLRKNNIKNNQIDLRQSLNNMKKFHSLKKMQEGVIIFIVNFLSSNQERDNLMKSFKKMDLNGDGKISVEELKIAYQKTSGMDPVRAQKQAIKVFQKVDKDRSGFIDYSQFLASSMNIQSSLTESKLESAFRMLDQDGNGTLSLNQLKAMLGPTIPTEVYAIIVKEFDKNKNGEISKDQFVSMMKQLTTQFQK